MDKALARPIELAQKYHWLTLTKIAFIVGAALIALYAVGLWQLPAAHAAFHDIRHAAGFPCH